MEKREKLFLLGAIGAAALAGEAAMIDPSGKPKSPETSASSVTKGEGEHGKHVRLLRPGGKEITVRLKSTPHQEKIVRGSIADSDGRDEPDGMDNADLRKLAKAYPSE